MEYVLLILTLIAMFYGVEVIRLAIRKIKEIWTDEEE